MVVIFVFQLDRPRSVIAHYYCSLDEVQACYPVLFLRDVVPASLSTLTCEYSILREGPSLLWSHLLVSLPGTPVPLCRLLTAPSLGQPIDQA